MSNVYGGKHRRGVIWRAGLLALVATVGIGSAAGSAGAQMLRPRLESAAGVALTNGSLYNVVDQIGARSLWKKGFTGQGIGVAVIDTGVADVAPLQGATKVTALVDLTGEAAVPQAQFRDTYGHGTHMAGIIAGRDPGADPSRAKNNPGWFLGVAPDASIISVKVGDNSGAVDVTQVIAGIDWVVENASLYNIRVISLSYGSGSYLPYNTDPVTAAVERAWFAGIVVVVAAGNDGRSARLLGTPANDPYVIAVAAAELKNNGSWKVPQWATSGDGTRNPDLTAPGTSIVSLRAPGSRIDVEHSEGYVSPALFKGSGSSQATAVTAGAVALLLSARPTLTPDQVKAILRSSANKDFIKQKNDRFSGEGLLQIDAAYAMKAPQASAARQTWAVSNGSGSLDQARGDTRVVINGQILSGEVTVTGAPWNGSRWTGSRWTAGNWDGSRWTASSWLGSRWTSGSWTGSRWTGSRWTGMSFTSGSWTGDAWTSGSWTGSRWTGSRWTDASWTSVTWDGSRWTGSRWTDAGWTGSRWTDAAWS
jgi:serine protease AprX